MLEVIDTNLDSTTYLADGRVADGIPAGLDAVPPGAVLAAWLSAIDVENLSGYDRIVVLRAHQRMATHYTAHTYLDMAGVTDILGDEFGDHTGEREFRRRSRDTGSVDVDTTSHRVGTFVCSRPP